MGRNQGTHKKILKAWFFEKVKQIDKPLANQTKVRGGKAQINKLVMKRGIW
jgi:hypothetical protein